MACSGAFDGFSPWIYGHNVMVGCTLGNVMVGSSRWWGLLAGGVFSPWIYGQREGWKEGLNHLYCPTYSRGPFICSVQNIANRYCTECIIGIVQNAGTPSQLRFARPRRDEG